ncbi:MAG: hypothetical protein JWM27_892, partial [Gemmatimonadetes bacterium]|nr:hypothetical protein [Gemmatimonadota bacterium]
MRLLRLAFVLLLLAPAALAAQVGVTTDILRGRVLDEKGTPLAGARVEATSAETGVHRTTTTGADGRYTLTFPEGGGRYSLRVSSPGQGVATSILARAADEEVLVANFRLTTQPIQLAGITARATRPAPGRGEAGGTERAISGDLANRLPIDNPSDPTSLAALVPGVVTTTSSDSSEARGSISVAGQRAALNNVTLDGTSFTSRLTGGQSGGGSPVGVPSEGVRATSVVTNTFDVSRGEFSGGLIAMTTRAGSNIPNGSLTYALRDPSLQSGGSGLAGSGYTQNRISGGYGAALIKDRLFAYGSGQYQRRTDDLFALTSTDPGALNALGVSPDSVARFLQILSSRYGISGTGQTGDFARVGNAVSLLGRIDFLPVEQQTVSLRALYNGSRQDNSRVGFLALRQNGGEQRSDSWGLIGTLTSRFGGGYINEMRLSFNDDSRRTDPYALLPQGSVRVGSQLADGTVGFATLAFGGNRSMPQSTDERTVEASDELSLLVRETHRLKLGAFFNHASFTQASTIGRNGLFSFNSLADLDAQRPASFSRSLAGAGPSGGGISAALYLGDTWRPVQQVQVTYGVRAEGTRFDHAPAANAQVASLFGRGTDYAPSEVLLSPRAGFSWRLSEQGAPLRLLRGGIGEFRGRAPYSLYAAALNQTGTAQGEQQVSCVGAGTPFPDYGAFAQDPGSIPDQCVGGASSVDTRLPNVTTFDRGFKNPRSWRASLGFQSQVFRVMGATVDASYALGQKLYGVRDLNLGPAAFTLASEGGRPVYAPASAIVPATGEVDFNASRLHPEYGYVFGINSGLGSRTAQVTLGLNGVLPRRIFYQTSYTFSRSRDQSSFSCCTPQQGFLQTQAAFDPNRPEWATSDFERRHSVNAILGMPATAWLDVSLVGRASSGSPYTPVVGGDVNGDGGSRNDRAFIFAPGSAADPLEGAAMQRLLDAAPDRVRECLESQVGTVAARNSCRSPWSTNVDLRASIHPNTRALQQRLQVSVDALNLGAGLDRLVHGADGLSGWGQPGFGGDNVLLYPRGFDPVTHRYRYQVNENFGRSRFRGTGGTFQVQVSARVALGRAPQGNGGFGGGLAAIALGGLGGGGAAGQGGPDRGGRGGGGGFDPSSLVNRVLPDPITPMLDLRDSLKLTPAQVTSLRAIADSLKAKNGPVGDSLAAAIQRQMQTQAPAGAGA